MHLLLHHRASRTFCGTYVGGPAVVDSTIVIDEADCKKCLGEAVAFGEDMAKIAENKLRVLAGEKPKL